MDKVYIALTTTIEHHKHLIKEDEHKHYVNQIIGVFSDYQLAYDACKTDADVIATYFNTDVRETNIRENCLPVIVCENMAYFIVECEINAFAEFSTICFDVGDLKDFFKSVKK